MIVATIKRIEAEIDNLEETVLIHGEGKKKIRVRHMVVLTMLDGKSRCGYVSIITIIFPSIRKAYTQDLLAKKVQEGIKGLKQHGDKAKQDNRTCLFCLAPPNTYHDPESLEKHPVFMEFTRLLGVSCMHLKTR